MEISSDTDVIVCVCGRLFQVSLSSKQCQTHTRNQTSNEFWRKSDKRMLRCFFVVLLVLSVSFFMLINSNANKSAADLNTLHIARIRVASRKYHICVAITTLMKSNGFDEDFYKPNVHFKCETKTKPQQQKRKTRDTINENSSRRKHLVFCSLS